VTTQLHPDIVHRLSLAKQLLSDARRLSMFGQDKLSFARGLLCLHDGAEIVLATIATQLSCPVGPKTSMLQYPALITTRDPSTQSLLSLNDLNVLTQTRNLIKHGGILPDRAFLAGIADRIAAMSQALLIHCLKLDIQSIWLLDAISDPQVKSWLQLSLRHIDETHWEPSLVATSHAMYHMLEKRAHNYSSNLLHSIYPSRKRKLNRTYPFSTDYQVILLGYGVDPRQYAHFRTLTPITALDEDGQTVHTVWDKWHGHDGNWTEANARWCLEFCIDCAYKVQSAEPDYPEPIPYLQMFVDEIRARSGDVQLFNLPQDAEKDLRPMEIQKTHPRKAIFTLRPGQSISGYVVEDDEDYGDEVFVVGLRDHLGHQISELRAAYIQRDAIEWERKSRSD
jgi:hypothetical protein